MAKPKTLPYDAAEAPGPFSVTLHSTAGGSDKIYKLSIEKSGSGWIVNFANGRRGGTMATGTKTANGPVDYAAARKACNSVLYDKVGSGYVPIGGSRFGDGMKEEAIATASREASGYIPQLLLAITTEAELDRYINDPDYVGEQKFDGDRRFLIVKDGEISGGNRKGQTVALSNPIAKAAATIKDDVVLDGEQVGDTLYFWDVLSFKGEDVTGKQWFERDMIMVAADFSRDSAIQMVPTARTAASKRKLVNDVKAAGGEGVVFKLRTAPYDPGKPGSNASWVKFKFWQSLSAVVAKVNDKRSVALELFEDGGKPLPVGNVTIPANQDIPKAGDIVEIRYLYAFEGGSLFQPTYLGKRKDLDKSDCLANQRLFKTEIEEEATAGMKM